MRELPPLVGWHPVAEKASAAKAKPRPKTDQNLIGEK